MQDQHCSVRVTYHDPRLLRVVGEGRNAAKVMERAGYGRLPVVLLVAAAADKALVGPGSALQDETVVGRLRVCVCAGCEAGQQQSSMRVELPQ